MSLTSVCSVRSGEVIASWRSKQIEIHMLYINLVIGMSILVVSIKLKSGSQCDAVNM